MNEEEKKFKVLYRMKGDGPVHEYFRSSSSARALYNTLRHDEHIAEVELDCRNEDVGALDADDNLRWVNWCRFKRK